MKEPRARGQKTSRLPGISSLTGSAACYPCGTKYENAYIDSYDGKLENRRKNDDDPDVVRYVR
jgi:hypothetical protein